MSGGLGSVGAAVIGFSFVDAFHDVESLQVLFDGPQEIGTSFAYSDAVAMAEDMVDDGHHSLFAGEVWRAVEFCTYSTLCG